MVKFLAYGWSSRRSRSGGPRPGRRRARRRDAQRLGRALGRATRSTRPFLGAAPTSRSTAIPRSNKQCASRSSRVFQASARAERRPIAAKGLTGPGYDGHTFWDTETFVLPVLTYTEPDVAADSLRWRLQTMPQAVEHARQLGLSGAAFPVAHHPRRRVLRLLARRHRRVPRQRRHQRRRRPLRGCDGGRRVRTGGRASRSWSRPPACGEASAITTRTGGSASTA